MKKKPMTTAEFFDKIVEIMKDNGSDFSRLEYAICTSYPVPITTYEFSIKGDLNYGGSEGMYLDMSIERYDGNRVVSNPLGCMKILDADREAVHVLSDLLADFLYDGNKYTMQHLDDFTFEGFDVNYFNGDDVKIGGYECATIERAEKRKDDLLTKYPKVQIRDNATRNVSIYNA